MILFYCGYYILEFSFGVLWWGTSKLYNSFVYTKRIEYTPTEELKKEIIELKELIKSTTGKIKT
tara:strand:+ start:24 stop:215 length:192 start_codon:yes stop_codon:yes gene_type:complete